MADNWAGLANAAAHCTAQAEDARFKTSKLELLWLLHFKYCPWQDEGKWF